MRTIDSVTSVIKPSNFAWWHRSWTGRFILAALLIAAAAFVLTPGRTSAQDLVPGDICKSVEDDGNIPVVDLNDGLVADCKALVAIANSLGETDNVGRDINWIGEASLDEFLTIGSWNGVMVDPVDDDDDADTDDVMRVTEVDLMGEGLTGKLVAAWADLTELTTLDLSGNGLSGTVPRDVWAFLDEKIEEEIDLNLDGNPMLLPSPPLKLQAVVSKIAADLTDAGKTKVTLSFDNVWYTTEVRNHEWRYKAGDGDFSEWAASDPATGCEDDQTPPQADLCDKLDDDARVRITITSTPTEDVDTYIYQVRSVKTDGGATDDPVTRSESSQIDVVGPQTLTAKSMYSLPVKVAYTAALSSDEAKLTVKEPDADADTFLLMFDPLEETEAGSPVTVTLSAPSGATSGSHTFPVEILEAGSAPTVSNIPNQSLVQKQRPKRVDLSRYFTDSEDLVYLTPTYTRAGIVTATINGQELTITAEKEGLTDVTVTAIHKETKARVSETFRVRVSAPNNAPQLIGNIPDLTLYLDDAGTQVDMTPFFRDQDNEFLRYIPQSSNPMVLTATSVGRNVIFNVNGLGEITMTIIAQDGAGATAFGSFKVTVLDPNAAPEAVGTIPPQTLRLEDPGLALRLGSYFTDADNDPLTYMAVSADKGVVTVEVTEAIVTLTAVAEGGSTVTVTATDPGGKSATQEILVTVLPANRPPEAVGQIPDQTLQYNDEPLGLDVTMYFTDPDGDELSYVGEGTDESVAEVRVHSDGLVRVDPLSHGEIEVTVTARDPLGASVSQSFMVTVQGNLPPEAVGVIDDQVLLEGGSALTINVEKYFSDPNGDELAYMATSSNPDAVQAVVIDGSSELVLRPFAPAEEVTVTVTAMDPEGESAAQLVMVSVAAAAPPPTATPMPTATPEPTAIPEPTATPAPTATFVPTNGDGGFPVGLIIVLLLVLAGVAAAVFIIQRRR